MHPLQPVKHFRPLQVNVLMNMMVQQARGYRHFTYQQKWGPCCCLSGEGMFSRATPGSSCLGCVLPKAEPEARTWEQAVYFGGDLRKLA